jgi:hypothetical protein
MPYAVTLPLDAEAAAQIRQMWCALAEQAPGTDELKVATGIATGLGRKAWECAW